MNCSDEHVTSLPFHLRFIVLRLSRLTVTVCSLEDRREGAGQIDQVVASAVGRAAG